MAKTNVREAKKQAIQKAIKSVRKEYGKGSIIKMNQEPFHVPRFSSGSLALDNILGGGLPRGRVIELYGPEEAGKTTLALEAVASVQKQGGYVAYVDAESSLSPDYAKRLGVDVDDLLIIQPKSGEDALGICNKLIESSGFDLIIIDSVAALVPRQEIEGEMGDNHVGLQARMMSQALRTLSTTLSETNTTCIFINQIRKKVGVMFGNPETQPGGEALKFYSSVILRIGGGKKITKGKQIIGRHTRIKITKNKVAPPFRTCYVDIIYGLGISKTGELLDMAVNKDIINKSGSWFSYKGIRLGQGRENVKKFLSDAKNIKVTKDIDNQVHKAYNIPLPKSAKQNNNKDNKKSKAKGTKNTKDTQAKDNKASNKSTKSSKDDKQSETDDKSKKGSN